MENPSLVEDHAAFLGRGINTDIRLVFSGTGWVREIWQILGTVQIWHQVGNTYAGRIA